MIKMYIIAIILFIVTTLGVIKFFQNFMKKETSEQTRKNWRSRMYYWHFILMLSGGITTLIILTLKKSGFLNL